MIFNSTNVWLSIFASVSFIIAYISTESICSPIPYSLVYIMVPGKESYRRIKVHITVYRQSTVTSLATFSPA